MERKFLRFIWRESWRAQLGILAIAVATFPFVYASLEIPKTIINEAIQAERETFSVFGVEMDRIAYLLTLCAALLATVGVVNALKWLMNVSIGRTGATVLGELRRALFETVLRFRPARLKRAKPGELVQSVMAEIEPLGGFIGEAFATPAFQTGLLAVYGGFIVAQDWRLGVAALALYPVQAWLIPRMQRRVVRLNRERASAARGIADFLGESLDRIDDIRVDDRARGRLDRLGARLAGLIDIRAAIYRRKYAIKVVNNLLNQAPPVAFYSIGGLLVIQGRLDFGALVAVIAAHKEMNGPWRELLAYYQNWQEFDARYRGVVESIAGEAVLPPRRLWGDPADPPLAGALTIDVCEAGGGSGGLTARALSVPEGAEVAVTGGTGGARDALLRFCAGLDEPETGRVALGGARLSEATLPQLGAAVGYVARDPGLFAGSAAENIRGEVHEAAAEPDGQGFARMTSLAREAGLAPELRALALSSPAPAEDAELWAAVARDGRAALDDEEGRRLREGFVAPWRPDALNEHASLVENLLYAGPAEAGLRADRLAERPAVAQALAAVGAERLLAEIGADIARELAQLMASVGEESAALDGLPGYAREEIHDAAQLAAAEGRRYGAGRRRRALAMLAARFTPARDRLDVVGPARAERLLALRHALQARVGLPPGLVRHEEGAVNPATSLLANMLAGVRRFDRSGAEKRLVAALDERLTAAGAAEALLRLGLRAQVGRDGARLSLAGRRRVAMIRAAAKRPNLLVLSEGVDEALRGFARATAPRATILYAEDDPAAAARAPLAIRLDEDGAARLERAA